MDQGIAAFLTQFDITSFVHNVDSRSKNLGPRPMNGFRVYVRYEWYRNRGQNNGDAGSGRAKNTCARALIIANLRCCVKGIERKEQKIFSWRREGKIRFAVDKKDGFCYTNCV
jgi:hypothetical protein